MFIKHKKFKLFLNNNVLFKNYCKLLIININKSASTWRLLIKVSCNQPRAFVFIYLSTERYDCRSRHARKKKGAIATNRLADRKCALRQFARTITMKWRETSRGDLTDKLRGMIVKRIKEARKGGGGKGGEAADAGIHSAGSVRPDAGRNHLFYINHTRAGRRATGFYAVYLRALGRRGERDGTVASTVFVRFSNVAPTRKESWCMSLAVMRRPDALYARSKEEAAFMEDVYVDWQIPVCHCCHSHARCPPQIAPPPLSSFHRPASSSRYYFPITFINCFTYARVLNVLLLLNFWRDRAITFSFTEFYSYNY